MPIKSRININAGPEQIWPYLADPALMARWNPKIDHVDRSMRGPVSSGETFTLDCSLNGPPKQSRVEVVECDRPRKLILRHRIENDNAPPSRRRMTVLERYELIQRPAATQVIQKIDFVEGIPRLVRWLMWIIFALGYSPGKSYMTRLKEAVEQGRAYPGYQAEAVGGAEDSMTPAATLPAATSLQKIASRASVKLTDDGRMLELREPQPLFLIAIGLFFVLWGLWRLAHLIPTGFEQWQPWFLQVLVPVVVGGTAAFAASRPTLRLDRQRRLIIWRRNGLLLRKGGQTPFDQITDVRITETQVGDNTRWSWRLELRIGKRILPVSFVYSHNEQQIAQEVADQIRAILQLRPH